MSTLQVNGTGFLTGDQLQIRFADVDGGVVTYNLLAYNPVGPNAGNTSPDVSVSQWTDTLIEATLTDPLLDDKFLTEVVLDDFPMTYTVLFNVNPDIPVPDIVPFIEDFSYLVYYDTLTSPGSWQFPGCGNIATQNSVPGIFFYLQNFVVGGGDGVRLTVDGLPVDYRYSVDPQFFESAPQDGFFLLADPALAGSEVAAAQPLDINGNPVGAPAVLQFNYNTATIAGVQTADTDVLEIQWDFCPETPTQLNVIRCAGNQGQTYYDPLGPQAGLNPGGATFVQWDTTAVIIDHPALIGTAPIDRIECRDQFGRTLFVIGNPIPTV